MDRPAVVAVSRLSKPFVLATIFALGALAHGGGLNAHRASPWRAVIAFASNRAGNFDIYTMSATGASIERLTNDPADDFAPTWSPDGKRIAFLSQRGLSANLVKDGFSRLFVIAAEGGSAHLVTARPLQTDRPAWSPDGSKIAVALPNYANSEAGIFLVSVNDGHLARLTRAGALEDDLPSWSPNGKQIAFVASDVCCPPHEHVYVMQADGHDRQPVTRGNVGRDSSPTWSPDGSRLAFGYSFRTGMSPWRYEIKTVSPDGKALRTLTNGSDPTWSPSGSQIAFVRDQSSMSHIFVINARGGAPVQLTYGHSADVEPAWRPTG